MAEQRILLRQDELSILDWTDGNRLSEVIAKSIPACKQLDILVGYFYFNGIEEIRHALERNPDIRIRILVGMDTGMDSKGLVEYAQRHEVASAYKDKIRDAYRRPVKAIVSVLGSENNTLSSFFAGVSFCSCTFKE